MGCPLHCSYCINDWCHGDASKAHMLTPEELVSKLRIDNLYFQATGEGYLLRRRLAYAPCGIHQGIQRCLRTFMEDYRGDRSPLPYRDHTGADTCRGTCPMYDKEVSDLMRQLEDKGQTEIRLTDLSSILIGKEEDDDKDPECINEEDAPLDDEIFLSAVLMIKIYLMMTGLTYDNFSLS